MAADVAMSHGSSSHSNAVVGFSVVIVACGPLRSCGNMVSHNNSSVSNNNSTVNSSMSTGMSNNGDLLVYALEVSQPVQSWKVLRSQDHFDQLYLELLSETTTTPIVTSQSSPALRGPPRPTLSYHSTNLNSLVRVRDDLQNWLNYALLNPTIRESSVMRHFLTFGANTIPPPYESVAWTQFYINQDHNHHSNHQEQHVVDDMDMDYMFMAEEEDDNRDTDDGDSLQGNPGDDDDRHDHNVHPHDLRNHLQNHHHQDYIPSAAVRYKPTQEDVADEDEMDLLQFAVGGGEVVEMVDDIGSLAQSLGASHVGRSLMLQAEIKQQQQQQQLQQQPPMLSTLLTTPQQSKGATSPSNSGGGGIGSAMADVMTKNSNDNKGNVGAANTNYWNHQATHPRLDSFKLLKVIGKGSFGKVFLVKENKSGELYALKVLRKDNIIKRNQIEHTKTERSVLGYVRHPFIVGMNMAFQSKDKLYFVLDYCAGGELFFHLGKVGRFPEPRARFYAAEIVLALSYVHSLDIVYRDLKPENVLLDDRGHVRLTDFGLSKEGISNSSSGAHSFCGTPEYLAPEILNRQGHGCAVDWWSLGALLYEMLTGLPPFYCQDRERLFEKIRKSELTYPSTVSPSAKSLLQGLLRKDPNRRLGSGPGDAEEIKRHEFFHPISWEKLFRGDIPPPWVPKIKGSLDTSQFDKEFTNMPVFSPQSIQKMHGFVGSMTPSTNDNPFEGFTFTDRVFYAPPAAAHTTGTN